MIACAKSQVPWQLTLRIDEGDTAVANTPVESETPDGPGMKRVRFAQTPPLPSYLVAFAVGPFEIVDGVPCVRRTGVGEVEQCCEHDRCSASPIA